MRCKTIKPKHPFNILADTCVYLIKTYRPIMPVPTPDMVETIRILWRAQAAVYLECDYHEMKAALLAVELEEASFDGHLTKKGFVKQSV